MIPVSRPVLGAKEAKILRECIETGWISSEGPFVSRFEECFAERVDRRHGIAVCNGTAALETALSALSINPGDEVILPTFTIISCAAAVLRVGATPVLVDSDPLTWNMQVGQIEAKITSRTRAILAVHTYGLPVDMDPLMDLASQHGLAVIEDAAEAHGLNYKNRPCGSFGDLSTFSFYPNKLVTTGEGGMVVTDSEPLAEKCRSFRNLCFQPGRRFIHETLGWNYRMTNLQAAVGLAQLDGMSGAAQTKRAIGRRYTELLEDFRNVQLPVDQTAFAENGYWVYGIVLGSECTQTTEQVIEALSARGIGTRPFFWPMHEQPVFRKMGLFEKEKYPVSERLARKGFYLPSYPELTEEEQACVAEALREVVH